MEPYAKYGPFYDATQGKGGGKRYLKLIQKFHPEARTVLELACGTGRILNVLSDTYDVEGLDNSRTMLRLARKKLPKTKFHHQDMARFGLKRQFDAILCPSDSINHLMRFTDWRQVFRRVARHLNPKGIFIFDINTEARLRKLAAAPPWVHEFGKNHLIMDVIARPRGVTDWDIKVFESIGRNQFTLHHEVIQEKSFPASRIRDALVSHFKRIRVIDPQRKRPSAKSDNLVFVCSI